MKPPRKLRPAYEKAKEAVGGAVDAAKEAAKPAEAPLLLLLPAPPLPQRRRLNAASSFACGGLPVAGQPYDCDPGPCARDPWLSK